MESAMHESKGIPFTASLTKAGRAKGITDIAALPERSGILRPSILFLKSSKLIPDDE
jgi:hypothetical protein